MTGLSKNAQNVLSNLKKGRFYKAYDPKTPKAMQELIDAGLVETAGRVEVIVSCYVPAEGYTPYVEEKFE